MKKYIIEMAAAAMLFVSCGGGKKKYPKTEKMNI